MTELPNTPKPKAPRIDDGAVDPDNFHSDGTPEAPIEGLLAAKPGIVKPDNFHSDGTVK